MAEHKLSHTTLFSVLKKKEKGIANKCICTVLFVRLFFFFLSFPALELQNTFMIIAGIFSEAIQDDLKTCGWPPSCVSEEASVNLYTALVVVRWGRAGWLTGRQVNKPEGEFFLPVGYMFDDDSFTVSMQYITPLMYYDSF